MVIVGDIEIHSENHGTMESDNGYALIGGNTLLARSEGDPRSHIRSSLPVRPIAGTSPGNPWDTGRIKYGKQTS